MQKLSLRKSVKKYPFLHFVKKMLMSTVLSRQFKANYLEKIRSLPQFDLLDSNIPCKDRLFSRDPNLAIKPLYLVGEAV